MKTLWKTALCGTVLATLLSATATAQLPGHGPLGSNGNPTRSADQPDLIVSQFVRTGAVVRQGGQYRIPFRLTIKNNGYATAETPFATQIRLANQSAVWTEWFGGLPPGLTRTFNGVIQIPDNGMWTGGRQWTFIAKVDAPIAAEGNTAIDWIQESNEFNNQAWMSVRTESELDLTSEQPTSDQGLLGQLANDVLARRPIVRPTPRPTVHPYPLPTFRPEPVSRPLLPNVLRPARQPLRRPMPLW